MAQQNRLNNRIFNGRGEINLTGVKPVNGFVFGAGTGNIDVYTAPAGKRAAVYYSQMFNPTGGTIQAQLKVKISGVYYAINTIQNITTLSSNGGQFYPMVLEPGESIAITTNATGININCNILEFDATSAFFSKKVSLVSGNNTIYTCPTNTTAFLLDGSLGIYGSAAGKVQMWIANFSVSTATYNHYIVPSGGTAGATNQFFNGSPTTNANQIHTCGLNAVLTAGDFLVTNTNVATATQFCWINVMEISNS